MSPIKRNNQPVNVQSIFRQLYSDPKVIALQLLLGIIILFDYFYTDHLFTVNVAWVWGSVLTALLLIISPRFFHKLDINNLVGVIVFHGLASIFLIFIAPVGSPYEVIAILLLYISIYWYGKKGFWFSFAAMTVTFHLAALNQLDLLDESDAYNLALKTVLLFILGAFLERLHSLDYGEREQLMSVSREVTYEQERLRSLINSMADAVVATNSSGKILVYNGAALDLLNTNKSLDGQPLHDFLKTYSQQKRPIDLLAHAKHEDVILKRDDLLLKVDKNDYLNIYVSVAPIQLSFGEKGEEGFIMLIRDITREKSIEEQRDEFISVVSHELRTPIAIAEANISTAMLPEVLKDQSKVVELMEQSHKNVLFLADMVNDITTLAHAERGDLEAEIEPVSIQSVLEEIEELYSEEVTAKGLKLKIELAKGTPPTIESNAYRIKEILQDFMTNAIKYTDKGNITVKAEGSDAGVRFSVKDSGMGISRSDQKLVFKKFWRSEDYRTQSHSGTGLGLYIAKKLAERMHGSIGLTSKLNSGSTFYLDLPISINQSRKEGR